MSGTAKVVDVELDPAEADEVDATIAVMGGEDWEYWIEALQGAEVLASGFETVAYTYTVSYRHLPRTTNREVLI